MMDFRERLTTVLHHGMPDQVPFAPYDNLVPRGDFERAMRNRGMGLLVRCHGAWTERPHVREEISTQGDITTVTHHTPVGSVRERHRVHVGRQYGDIEIEGLIKSVQDIDPVIYMIEDTVYHPDPALYHDTTRDLGCDGLVRVTGPRPAYDQATWSFGLSTAEGVRNWVYTQQDNPDHFAKLVEACARSSEKLLPIIAESPCDFVDLGSLNGFYGPGDFYRYVLPYYKEAVSYLHAHGKTCSIHAHAPGLKNHKELLKESGIDVVEAFTPPPYADLSIAEAREAWGDRVVIWVNFPETIFYSGPAATRQYTIELLQSDRSGSLVIGFTESGLASIVEDEVERTFKAGFEAIMEAIEEHGNLPAPS